MTFSKGCAGRRSVVACTATPRRRTSGRPAPPRRRKPRSPSASAVCLPKKNMIAAPKAGNSGISQMCSRKNIAFSCQLLSYLAVQLSTPTNCTIHPQLRAQANELLSTTSKIHFIHVDRLLIPEEGDQNAEPTAASAAASVITKIANTCPCSPHMPRERHQIQIHGIQDQLNRHQHDDHIPARQHTDRRPAQRVPPPRPGNEVW